MTKYSTQLKTKLVLEVLNKEKTLNVMASEYNIYPNLDIILKYKGA
ncbi:MAG: hypothetical protein KAJ49_10935 [Arcobacteraceae bacterium]|nr:hypothetical protein [Arcobacteraceae bacterium]